MTAKDKFDLIKKLGEGHFGVVWLVKDIKLRTQRALKIIPKVRIPSTKNFFHEAQVLKEVQHENIVRVQEAGDFDEDAIYVAMEYLSKGSLEKEAKGKFVYLTRAKQLMIDILRGLEHAHSKGILHKDIKPANIMIGSSKQGKLSDFGLAIKFGKKKVDVGMKDYIYQLHYPPEVLKGKGYNKKSEIYSCGVTLYRLVNGDEFLPPPSADFVKGVIDGKIPDRKSYRDFVPISLKRVINQALQVDPNKRFDSALEMRRALERVNLCLNWDEIKLENSGREWVCSSHQTVYVVTLSAESGGGWTLEFSRGASRKKLKKVRKLCATGLTKAKALSKARKILQGLTVGKKVKDLL